MRRRILLLIPAVAVLFAMPAATETREAPAPSADPAVCATETGAEASPSLPGEAVEAALDGVGLPEPTEMACANQWYEYRWVYAGCCSGSLKKTKEQRRVCCFDQNGTTCSGWSDTGATDCGGPCPI